MTPPITRRQSAMIVLLKQLGPGWHSRNEIATAKGVVRLNPVDIEALDELAIRGFIVERELQPGPREAVFQWHYRLKDDQGGDYTEPTDEP